MIKSYLKVAVRYFLKNKIYTAINILGLSVGFGCCILILLFVRSEFSFDRFNSKSDRLYRAWLYEKKKDKIEKNTLTPFPLGEDLKNSFPEIENICRIYSINSALTKNTVVLNQNVLLVDISFFKLFDFPAINIQNNNQFSTNNSVVITESTAKRFFADADPIGQTIELQLGTDKVPFIISGVTADNPEASSIQYDVLVPFANITHLFHDRALRSWHNTFAETYVLLHPGENVDNFDKKLPGFVKKVLGEDYKAGAYGFNMQAMPKIHLDTSLPAGIQPISDPIYSYTLIFIGLLILLIACINFLTLTIGRSSTRSIEVGVRKVIGAGRSDLIKQFCGEAFLIVSIALAIGLLIAAILLKPFNSLINRNLTFSFDFLFLFFCLSLLFIISIISGIYPAIVLSRFSISESLRGKLKLTGGTSVLRSSLMMGQFTASICMLICTIIIGQQLNFIKNKDLGYVKDQVVTINTNKRLGEGMRMGALFRDKLLNQSQVISATVSFYSFSETPWAGIGYMDNNANYRKLNVNVVDPLFLKTANIKLISGNDFSLNNTMDLNSSMIVNEALVKEYGWKNPIGQSLPGKFSAKVIGVVKDFNYESLHKDIEPLALVTSFDSVMHQANDISFKNVPEPHITVHLKKGSLIQNIEILKKIWKATFPDQDFEYHFLDESIANQYKSERRISNLIQIASFFSIFISCIGLFGIITLVVVQRTKEIGIRKILGASAINIIGLLSKNFIRYIFISAIVAFPIAWWIMNKWLQDFAFKVTITWWVFVVAGLSATFIAMITISSQTIKTAMTNPVKSLRSE